MFDGTDLYKIFIVITIVLIVKRICLTKNKSPQVTHYSRFVFFIWAAIVIIANFGFMLISEAHNSPFSMPLSKLSGTEWCIILGTVFLNVIPTMLLYVFTRKYATYHLVYKSKTKNKKIRIMMEESYVILHRMLGDKKIPVKDIVIEESAYYLIDGHKSKITPYAEILGQQSYAIIKLTNGKKIKLQDDWFLLEGGDGALRLAKELKIDIKRHK